ncbi:beta-ketoacyl-ACP synthase III [Paenibacillus doosanensis]|uniref:3-oxoacyl-[acyl-carrier-protein] synthase 3 n=1 Tax=Paenibacillus konkukensis TaxID=2020716 RepID=A0ABY4RUB8_9BACL|nr:MULTISPECIES: beta-ketoacyl-ACP synthase III [Paenibacillus]MCS7460953.1 beta-ketoacyl-ACP synthase III [Paenibacillus doosanensis]UQZ85622.1 3-oxoacyl-[acyl-carrier-protein] synthase 3 [Paenibacillus konkukensis]
MHIRNIKIRSTGKYLPKKIVTAREMDERLGVPAGWVEKKSDVVRRHFVEDETASQMGAYAATEAMKQAGLRFGDIDCLVCASGTMEQPIPSTASLIQRALGEEQSGVPCFDINSTCLSFLTALDVMSYMVASGRYRRILLVSSEIASIGLNWSDKESAALFGDGAAAVIVEGAEQGEGSRIVCSAMKTYSQGAHLSQIRGGGTGAHALSAQEEEAFLFEMDGQAIYKMAARILPGFVDSLLREAGCSIQDIELVIPHQGSAMAMRLIGRKLGIARERLMFITPTHGNTIAASIPMGLHEAIRQGRIARGSRIMLLGTSAGLSVGGMILDY